MGNRYPLVVILMLSSAIVGSTSILLSNFQLVYNLLYKYERLRFFEVPAALVVLSVSLNTYLFHRYNLKYRQLPAYQKAETALRLSNEKFTKAFQSCPDWLIISTLEEGRLVEVNETFLNESGYKRDEIIGKTKKELGIWLDISERKRFVDILKKHSRVNNLELCVRIKSGEIHRMLCSAELIELGGQTCIIAVNRDITKLKTLEDRLLQAQKMEAIGTLAVGIAHDFNNILAPIVGFTELILEDTPKGHPRENYLNEILKASKRAKDLTRQILAFGRQSDNEIKPLNIQPVIKEVMNLTRSTLPSTIDVKHFLGNGCGLIHINPTQFHQILMNLITNAFHAMEEKGGTLQITLNEVDLGTADLKDPSMNPGRYACLCVSDTGMGIDRNTIDKIFDPYFTTKAKDKGTGLGLSVVHGIVKENGGDIRVYSQIGRGSTFCVYLPVMQTDETLSNSAQSSVVGGSENILLVDDELSVICVEEKLLERLGYRVTARNCSLKAFEAFRMSPNKFDLVITDMTMPQMTGTQLAAKLREIRSDIPIIIFTGFNEQISNERAKELGIQDVIMKPVLREQIAEAARNVLDRKCESHCTTK